LFVSECKNSKGKFSIYRLRAWLSALAAANNQTIAFWSTNALMKALQELVHFVAGSVWLTASDSWICARSCCRWLSGSSMLF
jgi:hypothetical protein